MGGKTVKYVIQNVNYGTSATAEWVKRPSVPSASYMLNGSCTMGAAPHPCYGTWEGNEKWHVYGKLLATGWPSPAMADI